MKKLFAVPVLISVLLLTMACTETKKAPKNMPAVVSAQEKPEMLKLERVLAVYARPPVSKIRNNKESFLQYLLSLDLNRDLLTLVDKKNVLMPSYEPSDLVVLRSGKSYAVGRNGLQVREIVELALERMAASARVSGVTILASSAYRSYAYQEKIYNRNVAQMGKTAADRESAMPGQSQHQLGTVIDFGSITDEYAETKSGKWLTKNAPIYGFSLSFPQGMESVTGYRWECWHYRYIGTDAVMLQKLWFEDIQQYMLEFLHLWYAMD